ncbi:MAG: 2Fe-2S iron-sulfur cluster binding domain-containing protein [Chloroflexi bacterium]|nr:2Fe-2S iron-sulfur cluster binding domain-containing protein [Chloroflexota bacterium]PWB41888.1 MAG: hypothetical protein C3F10_14990 [Dehalococcoidia bacterium]
MWSKRGDFGTDRPGSWNAHRTEVQHTLLEQPRGDACATPRSPHSPQHRGQGLCRPDDASADDGHHRPRPGVLRRGAKRRCRSPAIDNRQSAIDNSPVPRIRVEPLGIEVDAPANETVMDAVVAHGFFWPVGCAKNGECTNCAMEVLSGIGRLSAMGRYERQNLLRQRGQRSVEDPRLRLACQARVQGDIVVYKSGVRPDTL